MRIEAKQKGDLQNERLSMVMEKWKNLNMKNPLLPLFISVQKSKVKRFVYILELK